MFNENMQRTVSVGQVEADKALNVGVRVSDCAVELCVCVCGGCGGGGKG